MDLADATGITGTAEYWGSEPRHLITMQDLIDAGIPIHGIEGLDPATVYVAADTGIQEAVWQRLAQRGKPLSTRRTLIQNVAMTVDQGAQPCPYCSLPEGHDACPVHGDGPPTSSQ